jgi:putative ABC transport system ATP-binding protein
MEVSGGQKQRAAIARALINRPELLLADEPTGNLDQKNSEEIMQIFLKLHERGETIIMVTHDEGIAMHCQKQVKMLDGCIRSAI